MNIIKYKHHDMEVSVMEKNKGKHRKNCLCFSDCSRFIPENRDRNCKIANELYILCCMYGIATPVWECSRYRAKKGVK